MQDGLLSINGLPIATFELKNSLTKQTVKDAVQQYKRDRDPRSRTGIGTSLIRSLMLASRSTRTRSAKISRLIPRGRPRCFAAPTTFSPQ